MRLSRLVLFGLAAGVINGCDGDDITTTTPPPLAQVRFVHAVNDTGAVDITMIDQVQWSAKAVNLAYRAGTEYFPTEAKPRPIRVFLTSRDPTITSNIMHETTVNLTAGSRVTLLLSGSARAGTMQLRVIDDNTSPPPSGQIGIRMVNTASGAIDAYYVATTTTAITPPPNASNVAQFQPSPYTNRAAGSAAVRDTAAGSPVVTASAAGSTAPAAVPGAFPGAGVNSERSMFSVYYFPAGVGQNAAVTSPSMTWFVDRNPAD